MEIGIPLQHVNVSFFLLWVGCGESRRHGSDIRWADGPAQSAIQYFENMRNFLVAVSAMNLLMFETSDIEKVHS